MVVLGVTELTSIADYFVLCSANTERQTQAIADGVLDKLRKEEGVKPLLVEGTTPGRWILIDFGDFIFHICTEDCRRFYGLERLWGDARKRSRGHGLGLGVLPFHGAGMAHRGDAEDDLTALEQPDSPIGLADDDGHSLGDRSDRGGGPVARAQALGERQSGHGGVDEAAGGLDRAVAGHDERPVQLRNLLDGLAHAEVADIPLLAAVALERVASLSVS